MDRGACWATVHGVTKESDATYHLNKNSMSIHPLIRLYLSFVYLYLSLSTVYLSFIHIYLYIYPPTHPSIRSIYKYINIYVSVQFSRSVVSHSLRPHEKHLLIWLHWVLVVTCRIFGCSMWTFSCSVQELSWSGINSRPPALGARSLSHWTTKESTISNFKERGLGMKI